jgi:ATP-binding cassette subfamily B protein RaxB
MLLYSPRLTGVVVAAHCGAIALRLLTYRPTLQLFEEGIQAHAQEQSILIETVRGMQAIKALGLESQRESLWQNRRVAALNADARSARWDLALGSGGQLLTGLQNLAVIYLGATDVLAGAFTVGMLYAFIAYKQQLEERLGSLIDTGVRYQSLRVHLSRLADLVHAREERGLRASQGTQSLKGRVELRDVSFRYSEFDPYVVRHVSLTLEVGELVVLVGRSGGGKTTLLKILLGLLEPSEGEVRIDGRPLREFGVTGYRRQCGSVMQDDQLFEGTIAENIASFAADEDGARIEAAARAAQIHDEITAMPMGYLSLIGNMGATLSGGQRQRVLLARAFYREPRLLVLDEGTANLDPEVLGRICEVLRQAGITRVLATHQPDVMRIADRVLIVAGGGVHAPPPAAAHGVSAPQSSEIATG